MTFDINVQPTGMAGSLYDKDIQTGMASSLYDKYGISTRLTLKFQPLVQELKLASVFKKLEALKTFESNWDGEGAKKPDPAAIKKARTFINLMYDASSGILEWRNPSTVSADTNGRVFLVWWYGKGKTMREISVYVSCDSIRGIRKWGQLRHSKIDALPLILEPEILKNEIWKWLAES